MIESIAQALVPYQGIADPRGIVVPTQQTKRERAEAKLAAAQQPTVVYATRPLPTWCDGYLPEGKISLAVESANVKLRKIPLAARDQMGVMVANFIDRLIDYEAGITTAHAFQNAVAGINSAAMKLHGELYPQPPIPRQNKSAFRDPVIIEQVRAGKSERHAAKLHHLLVTLLDIHEKPAGKLLHQGEMAYDLKEGPRGDSLIILRRTPDGRGWLSTERKWIATRAQAHDALFALEQEYQFRTGLLAVSQGWIIERAEVRTIEEAAAIIDRVGQEAAIQARVDSRMDGYIGSAAQRASAAAQAALPNRANPFAPQLAAGR